MTSHLILILGSIQCDLAKEREVVSNGSIEDYEAPNPRGSKPDNLDDG